VGQFGLNHRCLNSFEAACRMIEVGVGVGIMPESAARRHALNMDIGIVRLSDDWSIREMQICMRSLQGLPSFARDLVELLQADTAVQ
jgi:DNA-binding transcriptional LysR family regulator